jgi:peptidyl-prolyl cis-trans isomerase SurA
MPSGRRNLGRSKELSGTAGTGAMLPNHFMTRRGALFAAMIVIASWPAGTALAQTGGDVDDSEVVTELEIAQRSRLMELSTHKTPTREEVIAELRSEKLRVGEASRSGVDVPDSEVDAAYAAMASRMRLTPEQLTGQFAKAGVDVETLKHRMRADMAWPRYQQQRRWRQDPPPRDPGGG